MSKRLATYDYVNSKVQHSVSLGLNTLGNAFRIGIRKNSEDKAVAFVFGSHNAEPFAALIRVSWGATVNAEITNIIGNCSIRYTELNSTHAIIDINTVLYGVAYVTCTNPIYANFLGVN